MIQAEESSVKAKIIGKNIKQARIMLKLTQDELATLTDSNRITISRYETGKFFPSVPALEKLAIALKTTPAALSSDTPTFATSGLNVPHDPVQPLPSIQNTETMNNVESDIDYENAALKATETLIKHHISSAPIAPLPILESIPDVLVVSFTEMADGSGLDSDNLVTAYGSQNQDAITFIKEMDGKRKYFVAYNQSLPFYMLQRSLARELGHIILGHNETHSDEKCTAEALHFSRHLLCPRPLIKGIQESGINLTIKVFGNITGCYGRFLAGVRKTPGAHIPSELNRIVKSQFSDYISNLKYFRSIITSDDDSSLANFGCYMDNYQE